MTRKLSEAAKRFGIQHGTIKQWILRGHLKATKDGKRWMIEDRELESFLWWKAKIAQGRIRFETPTDR